MVIDIPLQLDLNSNNFIVIPIKQGDNKTRKLNITVFKNGTQITTFAGETGKVYIKKPNGSEVYINCTLLGSAFSAVLTYDALSVSGMAYCDFQLLDSTDGALSTMPFQLDVIPSAYSDGAEESSNQRKADRATANNVVNLIKSGSYTPARTAYNALTETQKTLVWNYEVLLNYEMSLAVLFKDTSYPELMTSSKKILPGINELYLKFPTAADSTAANNIINSVKNIQPIYSKNLFGNTNTPKTQNGITITRDEETDEYIINGTATSTGFISLSSSPIYTTQAGETIHLSVWRVSGTVSTSFSLDFAGYIYISNIDSNTTHLTTSKMFSTVTGLAPGLTVSSGQVFNNYRMKLQLEKTSATDWVRFGATGYTGIESARTAYNALTEPQKKLVWNYADLVNAELANENTKLKNRIEQLENEPAPIESKGIKKYTVTFTGSISAGTRADNAVGMVANVAVGAETVQNDFDSVSFFNRPICCCTWDTTARKWRVNAYRGEPGFALDGSNGEVMYECTPFYYKTDLNSYVSATATPCEGYTLAPMFKDGVTKVYCPVYWLSMVNGVATSRSGTVPQSGSLNSFMTNARTFDAKAHTETIKVRFSEYLLQLVEFATKDVQNVIMGACNMRYNGATDTITAVTSNTVFTVTAATAAYFRAGQSVSIGSAQNGENRTPSVVISSIVIDGANATITLASEVAGLVVGDFLSTRAWKNGATDIITASSGSIIDKTSGYYPFIWRGKVDAWADGFSTLCDILIKRDGAGTTEEPYKYTPYYLEDATKYNNGTITSDYIKANYVIPTVDGYVKTLGADSRYPFMINAFELGASSTTHATAYFYCPRPGDAVSAVRVGGPFYSGHYCSPVYFSCFGTPSNSGLSFLARLFIDQ